MPYQSLAPNVNMPFKKLFKRLVRKKAPIVIVSGLPRSGTSMMMQILAAGGINPVTDNVRIADQDNPKGYYEHEAVKALAKGNHDCLHKAEGCSLKVISTLLKHLPSNRKYKVIFMHRELDEVLASQAKMLVNLKKDEQFENDAQLRGLYKKHINTIKKWLAQQAHMDVLHLDYKNILAEPANNIDCITRFLNIQAHKTSMTDVIDQNMRHH